MEATSDTRERGNDACRWTFFVGLGMLALILLAVHFEPNATSAQQKLDPRAPPGIDQGSKENLCTTMGCAEAAGLVIHNMDPTVDPCENFHEYACGKYNQKNAINLWHRAEGVLRQQQLDLILTSNSTMSSVEKAKSFYEACRALGTRKFNADFREYIKKFGELQLIDQKLEPGMKMPSLTDSIRLATLYDYHGGDSYFHVHNTFIGIQATLVPDITLWFNSPEHFMFDEGLHALAADAQELGTKIEKIFARVEALGVKIAEHGRQEKVNELVEFYDTLGEAYENQKKIIPMPTVFNRFTIEELQKAAPAYDWLHFIGSHLPKVVRDRIEGQTPVRLHAPLKNLEKLSKILLDTPRHVVQNFLFMNWAKDLEPKRKERGDDCKERVLNHFSKLTEHLAIDTIRPKSDVEEVRRLGDEMRSMFHTLFDENTWLSDESKAFVKKKLDQIDVKYGYNQNAVNAEQVDALYENLQIPAKWNHLELMQFEERAEWLVFDLQLNGDLGMEEPLFINAFNRRGEQIVIPLGIITQPFFDAAWPIEFNYAGIGFVMAHELTHSFDNATDLPVGNPGNDATEFLVKQQCLVDQFDVNYTNPRLNVTLQVDGYSQKRETISDNNGLRVAWRAYLEKRRKLYGRNPPKLPGLKQFTNDQLFFLAHTQMYCGRQPTLYSPADGWKFNDVHPENSVRVNEELKNFEPFAVAFQCKLNATMNPDREECRIYRHRNR